MSPSFRFSIANTSDEVLRAEEGSVSFTDNVLCVRKALEMYHSMIVPAEDRCPFAPRSISDRQSFR